MFARRSLVVLAVALSVVRCADHPTAVQPRAAARQTLRWAPNLAPQFTATALRSSRDGFASFLTPPLSLDQYAVSFWAVRGESRSVVINYRDANNDTSNPFLTLNITDPVLLPDGNEIAVGDSVLITVTVDTLRIGVALEPSGLQFGAPAELTINYGGAGGDFNGDGLADSTDAYIEHRLLGLWYREGSEEWTQVPAIHSVENRLFTSFLPHFCEYELSFTEFAEWATSW